jgi:DNA-binding transcriptional LysR family regulator
MNIPVRSLRAALAVLEHRSFGRAANAVGISQPALSIAVAELEKRLGLPLFHRTTRSVQPTDAGLSFLTKAGRVLDELDTLVRDVEDDVRSRRGRVVVTCLSSIAGRLMPPVIRACEARYPGLEVVLQDDVATRALEAVVNGAVDFAVTGSLHVPPDLAAEDLLSDRLHVVCDDAHPFAAAAAVAWKELSRETLIILATNSGIRALIDGALATEGVSVRRYFEASQLATVHGMLEARMGVSVLPELALPVADHPFLVARPLVAPELARPIRLLWRRDRSRSPAHEAFVSVLRETVAGKAGRAYRIP